MESLPASRKIFLGCVYPGPLLYNNVVYGCPSTSDILLSEPEAKKKGGEGGHAIGSSITSILRLYTLCCATRTILKREFWGSSLGDDRYFSGKWELAWLRVAENNGISRVFYSGGKKGVVDLVLTILFTRVMDKVEFQFSRMMSVASRKLVIVEIRAFFFVRCAFNNIGIIASNCYIDSL